MFIFEDCKYKPINTLTEEYKSRKRQRRNMYTGWCKSYKFLLTIDSSKSVTKKECTTE